MVWGWIYTDVEFIRCSFVNFIRGSRRLIHFRCSVSAPTLSLRFAQLQGNQVWDKQIYRGLHRIHFACQAFCRIFSSVECQRQFMLLLYWRTMTAITSTIRQQANAMDVAFTLARIIIKGAHEKHEDGARYTMKHKRCTFPAEAGKRIDLKAPPTLQQRRTEMLSRISVFAFYCRALLLQNASTQMLSPSEDTPSSVPPSPFTKRHSIHNDFLTALHSRCKNQFKWIRFSANAFFFSALNRATRR